MPDGVGVKRGVDLKYEKHNVALRMPLFTFWVEKTTYSLHHISVYMFTLPVLTTNIILVNSAEL